MNTGCDCLSSDKGHFAQYKDSWVDFKLNKERSPTSAQAQGQWEALSQIIGWTVLRNNEAGLWALHVGAHTCAHTYICAPAHMHTHTHVCMHTCTHMHRVWTESSIIKLKLLSVLSDWLGPHQDRTPLSNYFSESKLQAWSSFTEFLEDTLKSVRKTLNPLFKNLQKSISGRMIGKVSDTSVPDQARAYFLPEQIQDWEWHKQNPVVMDTWSSVITFIFQIFKSNTSHVQNTGADFCFTLLISVKPICPGQSLVFTQLENCIFSDCILFRPLSTTYSVHFIICFTVQLLSV